MKTYEITYISKENVDEKTLAKRLSEFDGKLLSFQSLGEKQLAYPVNKENRGFYSTATFSLDPAKISELNRKFSLGNAFLRFLILSVTMPTTPKEPEKAEVVMEKKIEKIEEKVAEKTDKTEVKAKAPVKKKVAPKAVTHPESEESDEERLKALDKKLDELLKE